MTPAIRDARPSDEDRWRELWAQYLRFYASELAPQVTDATWSRIIDPESRLSCRLAEVGGQVMGFAVWHHHLASWHLADDCYIEDLYIDPDVRGHGLGRALLDDLFAIARTRGFGRIYWHTNEGNARARALYDSYAPADGHIRYRLRLAQ
jgi:GNAT superfamily N-acetyltransferase